MPMNRFCGIAAAACMLFSGCGEGGEEAVFLYFLHGYPGSGSMTVNGTQGVLVDNVPFGERHGDNVSCEPYAVDCLPKRVERQFGSEFNFKLENMTETVDVTADMFSMYPHETGTMVLTRRSDEAGVQATILRHTQSIDPTCGISFVNGLALTNEFTSGVGLFDITPEVRVPEDQFILGRFLPNEGQREFITECGALPNDDPQHTSVLGEREAQIARVRESPWMLLDCNVEDEEGEALGGCLYRWGVPHPDTGRVQIGEGGSFYRIMDTEEFYECVQGAISIRQPTDTAEPLFPDQEVQCPNEGRPLEWSDVDLNFESLIDCYKPITSSAEMIAPGAQQEIHSYFGAAVCNWDFRIRNTGQAIVFGPRGNDALGEHQDGALVRSEVDIPLGSQRFYVMIGRPVNPLVWQWDSADTFVDLSFYPYFNEGGDRPDVGEYDFP